MDKDILENDDIYINIDKDILENINFDMGILEKIHIDMVTDKDIFGQNQLLSTDFSVFHDLMIKYCY